MPNHESMFDRFSRFIDETAGVRADPIVWYAVKQVCVPGTEVPDIFRDAGSLKNVQHYLAKLSESVSSKLLEGAHPAAVAEAELQESARKGGSASSCAAEAVQSGSLYKVLLDKIAGSDRANHPGCLPGSQDHRADVPSMETRVWDAGSEPGQTAQGVTERKCPTETDAG